ncbi:hypothetical protein [Desulfonatronum parangueonense]
MRHRTRGIDFRRRFKMRACLFVHHVMQMSQARMKFLLRFFVARNGKVDDPELNFVFCLLLSQSERAQTSTQCQKYGNDSKYVFAVHDNSLSLVILWLVEK